MKLHWSHVTYRFSGIQIAVKYRIDQVTAALMIVVLCPLLALIAIAILIDNGKPVFFRQTRLGVDAQPFRIWKFRTMVNGADDLLDKEGVPKAPRVTWTGKFLRWTSLDELPNLLNIAAGQMSFVGPRPTLTAYWEHYSREQRQRFRMRPGVTGLAQVSGRNLLPLSERIRLDNEYIDEYSLWKDLGILARTLLVVVRREGMTLDRNPSSDDLTSTD
jgi:undecaprenyl phosphate N,N'-diacetylbacillosamine 1-phosphate transferase